MLIEISGKDKNDRIKGLISFDETKGKHLVFFLKAISAGPAFFFQVQYAGKSKGK